MITKIIQKKEPLTIIIPTAGTNRRMKKGPKALLEVGGEKLILRQIKTLKKTFPNAEFIVVTGYGADLIYPLLPSYVRCVENEFYETTNVSRSIALGLRAATTEQILIVYGDLVFSRMSFSLPSSSSLFYISGNPKSDIALNLEEDKVVHLSYISELKWAQVIFLTGKELELFRKSCYSRENNVMFGHEILNMVLQLGGTFKALQTHSVFELDTISDFSRLKLSEIKL